MLWTEATINASSWLNRPERSQRGLPMTAYGKAGGVFWWLPVLFCPSKRPYRCNLCGLAAASEIPSSNSATSLNFVCQEKASDHITWKVIWAMCWGMDCVVSLWMYANEQSSVRIGLGYSQEFKWRSRSTKAPVLHHHAVQRSCHKSSALKFSGRTSRQMILSLLLSQWRSVSGSSWMILPWMRRCCG